MKLELGIYELGKILKTINEKYKLEMYTILKLSGGWMTLSGDAKIEEIPVQLVLGCSSKSNNIINIRISNDNKPGNVIKLTGAKGKKFTVDISPTKFKEIVKGNINNDEIKISNTECKLRIDEDIIFKINASDEEIIKLIKK